MTSAQIAVVMTQLGRGGAERQTYLLLERLAHSPWRPKIVFCLSDDIEPYGPALQKLGYPLEIIERGSSYDFGRLFRLRRRLREEKIDFVHAVHLLASGYVFLAASLGRKPRLLPSARGTVVTPSLIKRGIYRWMFRSCSKALVNSSLGKEYLVNYFKAPRERIVVIPNGMDFDDLRRGASESKLRSELGIDRDAAIVGFVGKDSPVKNVPCFIDAMRRVMQKDSRLHAVLVGKGLDETARVRLAEDLPKQRLHLLGPRDDIAAVISGFDALVLTSNTEGCPNVVIEALGLGIPVISTAVGDVEEMIERGRTGFICPVGNDAEIAEKTQQLLSQREKFRADLRERLPSIEKRFSLETMVERTTDLWAHLLGC